MSLLFGMPEGIGEELEQALASIQTWAGKLDGLGKWRDIPYDSLLFGASATTFTVLQGQIKLRMSRLGDTVIVLFDFAGSTGGNTAFVTVRIPDLLLQRVTENQYVFDNGAGPFVGTVIASPLAGGVFTAGAPATLAFSRTDAGLLTGTTKSFDGVIICEAAPVVG